MIELVLNKINNYFYNFYECGNYEIINNTIEVKGKYIKGQYVRIEGSILNDGVYKVNEVNNNIITLADLTTEGFNGVISSLSIPKQLLSVITEIEQFENENKKSNVASESFGAYSYSVATNKNGDIASWYDCFKEQLRPYRKIYDDKRRVKCVK